MPKRTKVTTNDDNGKPTFLSSRKKPIKEPVDNSKVTITMTIDQAYTVMNAMEFYARIHIGQFDHIDWEFVMAQDCNGKDRDFWRNEKDREDLRRMLDTSRDIIFPELKQIGRGGSHGIYSHAISPRAHNAWDIYQVIRRELAIHREPNPTSYSTSYNTPMSVSESNPLPVVTIEKVE